MELIKGEWRTYKVLVNGQLLSPECSRKVHDYAPCFLWGYTGAGPSQFALALLLHFGATNQEALEWCQQFKVDVIAQLPQDKDFQIPTQKVQDWLDTRRIFSREFSE